MPVLVVAKQKEIKPKVGWGERGVMEEFSAGSRQQTLERFRNEVFDLLVVGGGITGAAVARDAASRGLKVALVERQDFAYGTSSRSSKLIHGGLRYLENYEFGLVFEALAERALLLKTAPSRVEPLKFYMPVFQAGPHKAWLLSLGMWFYDLLALFRAPGFHRRLGAKALLAEIPFLKSSGLKGGFRYYDASMWDDLLVIDILRSAAKLGAQVASYCEAVAPVWEQGQVVGFVVRDCESDRASFALKARQTVVCAGPWTDELGQRLAADWQPWLQPSKGVHLVFALKRIPLPGALVMSHPTDGRIAFVIPRPDLGEGVVIVGTTDDDDGPHLSDPDKATVNLQNVQYLLAMVQDYFPELGLSAQDILSSYVGVRPLMGRDTKKLPSATTAVTVLQKVSREHHMDVGPGGVVLVAGGKYTTHRRIAAEAVTFALKQWKQRKSPDFPKNLRRARTKEMICPQLVRGKAPRALAQQAIPEALLKRYGVRDALAVLQFNDGRVVGSGDRGNEVPQPDPAGFPALVGQLRYAMQYEMVMHLEDFFWRRVPLFAARKDHGQPWVERLSHVWAQERGVDEGARLAEVERLQAAILRHEVCFE